MIPLLYNLFVTPLSKHYHVKKEVGRGGFGKVYLVQRKSDKILFAAKKTDLNTQKMIRTPTETIPFEIYLLSKLSHPNIITQHEYLKTKHHWVSILDYNKDYTDLHSFINKHGPLTEARARIIFKQVLSAITYCLSQCVDHRDIKAENILLHKDTLHVKIIDFGSATFYTKGQSYTSGSGTAVYLPPEYFNTKSYTPIESTVWSLGCLLYCMIAARCPFNDTAEVMMKEIETIEGVSRECSELIKSSLNKSRVERMQFNDISQNQWMLTRKVKVKKVCLL